jgi:MFS family permease
MVGLRYVRDHPRLRALVLLFVGTIMLGFPHVTLLPGLVENELGHPAESISLLFGLSALAALTTSVVVARRADTPAAETIYVVTALGFGLSLFVLAWAPSFGAAIFSMVLLGAMSGGFQTLSGAVVIRETEPAFVGRVMSLTMMAFGGFGLVALPVGILGDAIGERATLVGMGCVVCVVVLSLRASLSKAPSRAG